MRKKKNIYLSNFDKLSSFLKGLSENEIAELEKGKLELKFELTERTTSRKSKILNFDEFTIKSLIDNLTKLNSREEGFNVLENKCSSKSDLESILLYLDVPFQKRDSASKLKDKIIENSIGYRLRSQAIQDNDMD